MGKEMKINPGPSDGSRPYVKTIGKIAMPARIATEVSAIAITKQLEVIEESFDK